MDCELEDGGWLKGTDWGLGIDWEVGSGRGEGLINPCWL